MTMTHLPHDVRGSVRHSIIHNKSNKMQQCIYFFISPYLHEAQHVSGDTPPIIRSLKLHWQPLVLYTWKVAGCVVVGRCPTTTHPATFHIYKTRGCQCSFRLLMMGGVSPKTCWALCKYGLIKKSWYTVASCWICYELHLPQFHCVVVIIISFIGLPSFMNLQTCKHN